ncbi:MAG: alanine racemase [Verrucomicrobia bacterium]|nr:alanine racemase [Verrucomicrobiota bacterium]
MIQGMDLYPHPAKIEIDLQQFKKNIGIIRKHIGKAKFCLPVKANAYGHGLIEMSKAAVEAGVDSLAVSCLLEGIWLRKAGIPTPILVFGAIHEDQVEDLIDWDLEVAIASKYKSELVADICRRLGKKCRVHLEVDTGMQRTGVRPATGVELFRHLKAHPFFEIVGIYSHLASAEHPNDLIAQKQIDQFIEFLKHPVFRDYPIVRHIANSGGTAHFPHSHLDMVRPGILAFGFADSHAPDSLREIAPCFTLKAKVSYFKVVPKGSGISYGHTFVTPKQTRVVTIPVGYGDGYRRSLSNKGSVLIRGKKYPIVGTICMDQFMVDIGDGEAYVGDEVVLIGKQGNESVDLRELARLSDSIVYEILCLFNERIPRIYKS